jgi:small subunit ribosomal protein S17
MNNKNFDSPISVSKRKLRIGVVTSRSGNKSVKVTIPYKLPHPRYGKVINRKTVVHAHDEENLTSPGDQVEIIESRPLSRLKRWRVVRILSKAVSGGGDHGRELS